MTGNVRWKQNNSQMHFQQKVNKFSLVIAQQTKLRVVKCCKLKRPYGLQPWTLNMKIRKEKWGPLKCWYTEEQAYFHWQSKRERSHMRNIFRYTEVAYR